MEVDHPVSVAPYRQKRLAGFNRFFRFFPRRRLGRIEGRLTLRIFASFKCWRRRTAMNRLVPCLARHIEETAGQKPEESPHDRGGNTAHGDGNEAQFVRIEPGQAASAESDG